jgi:hypothetical protein
MPQHKAGIGKGYNLRHLLLGAIPVFALSACLQTDPSGPGNGNDIEEPVEDNGRRAGATSSTNWPTEFGNQRFKAIWSFDTVLKIEFFNLSYGFPPVESHAEWNGTIHLYPAKVIPALDSVPSIEWNFEHTHRLEIPLEKINRLAAGKADTVAFNVRLDMDSIEAWFFDFKIQVSTGKIVETPVSPLPEKLSYLKQPRYFFQGSNTGVTSLLPEPIGKNAQISYYIPGTPEFCKAQTDSFHLGPLSNRDYPLRLVRISDPMDGQGGTLVEIWELRITGPAGSSIFSLGEQVLTLRTKGKLTLRDEE